MKENLKTQRELSKKVKKMNINLYWSNVLLKTKLRQEKSKGKTST
jgi:hypothetical protein